MTHTGSPNTSTTVFEFSGAAFTVAASLFDHSTGNRQAIDSESVASGGVHVIGQHIQSIGNLTFRHRQHRTQEVVGGTVIQSVGDSQSVLASGKVGNRVAIAFNRNAQSHTVFRNHGVTDREEGGVGRHAVGFLALEVSFVTGD